MLCSAPYFERMKAIVESHGGLVGRFIGDAVMAVYACRSRTRTARCGPAGRQSSARRFLHWGLRGGSASTAARCDVGTHLALGQYSASAGRRACQKKPSSSRSSPFSRPTPRERTRELAQARRARRPPPGRAHGPWQLPRTGGNGDRLVRWRASSFAPQRPSARPGGGGRVWEGPSWLAQLAFPLEQTWGQQASSRPALSVSRLFMRSGEVSPSWSRWGDQAASGRREPPRPSSRASRPGRRPR